jgi:hypothetical protein
MVPGVLKISEKGVDVRVEMIVGLVGLATVL